MRAYVILDRSSSMGPIWNDIIGGLKAYVDGLPPKTRVSLLAFDTEMLFPIRDMRIGQIDVLDLLTPIHPRGMTALNSAVIRMGKWVEGTAKKKAQIVILTDGVENASPRGSASLAAATISNWRGRGFDVKFIGADFDPTEDAHALGITEGQTLTFSSSKTSAVAGTLSDMARSYAKTGKSRTFTKDEREKAK